LTETFDTVDRLVEDINDKWLWDAIRAHDEDELAV
jgi:hypothetical protein